MRRQDPKKRQPDPATNRDVKRSSPSEDTLELDDVLLLAILESVVRPKRKKIKKSLYRAAAQTRVTFLLTSSAGT